MMLRTDCGATGRDGARGRVSKQGDEFELILTENEEFLRAGLAGGTGVSAWRYLTQGEARTDLAKRAETIRNIGGGVERFRWPEQLQE